MPPKKRKSAKSKSTKAEIIKKKAANSIYTPGDLNKVYQRGVAAYVSSGSRNVSVGAWAMGRVSSFVSGKGGARRADSDIHENRKKNPKKK